MPATINSVASIEAVNGNSLLVEVMPNTLRNSGLQFYYLNKDNNNINYTSVDDFTKQMKEIIKNNGTIYLTFCGINNKDLSVPDYLYLVFSGKDVRFETHKKNSVYLEFYFNKSGKLLQNEISDLFTNNVGVFIQGFI